jgi:hypothetical protein
LKNKRENLNLAPENITGASGVEDQEDILENSDCAGYA